MEDRQTLLAYYVLSVLRRRSPGLVERTLLPPPFIEEINSLFNSWRRIMPPPLLIEYG